MNEQRKDVAKVIDKTLVDHPSLDAFPKYTKEQQALKMKCFCKKSGSTSLYS